MNQKFFVYLILFIFVVLLFTCEQNQPIRQRRSPAETAVLLKEKLSLTDEQKDKIQKILEDQRYKMQELRDSFSGDRRQMRGEMRQLTEETDQLIGELLTDEQKDKYEEYKEERRGTMRDRFRERKE